ncbi:DUF5318 family protein [Corynebacterium sanguinis]|uniref:DUF5318 family protein n=1 Tax=Corynebacterium sanguinis TaxID=2594913 RepID=UPI001186AE94|nr:DUF5318 family protein [Corynebacterium sanguinis]MCT1426161.1 DUF5318 domain-containing protein [Corynebacterium sanguinis]MCT1445426.1 DUF5318 domain-containing protein [Corynebacterium sanguinis]MCT1499424.1 DUF5318 domain-containing protein [Corynebacterium sanguinis]MCT1628589.1 DUF5318 domain-containing protein [Corynebacterium sanguinis]MCT1695700.1 DUF5318 domain-containing protein [Corynebacterium sanguinis]
MKSVFVYSREVSHEWRRRTILKDYAAGRLTLEEVCDADFLLRAAAEHHGVDAARPCPICARDMREVKWIHGENLGRRSGTARSSEEIDRIVSEVGPVSVHVVEVCPHCRWNHLLREVTAFPVM